MTVGLKIRNANQILQIDGNYQNMELVSKSTFTINQTENDIRGRFIDVGIPGGRKNAVIACSEGTLGVYVIRKNATTFRIYSTGDSVPPDKTVVVYMFAAPLTTTNTGGIGLKVRNRTTGEVVYNSVNKYLRILDFINVSLASNAGYTTPSYSGKTVAVVQCLRPWGRTTANGGPPNQPIGIFGFNGGTMLVNNSNSTVNITNRPLYSAVGGAVGNTAWNQPSGTYLIVDVTGF